MKYQKKTNRKVSMNKYITIIMKEAEKGKNLQIQTWQKKRTNTTERKNKRDLK